MSVIPYTIEQLTPTAVVVTWSGLHNGDTGTPLAVTGFTTRGISASGTAGAGGELSIETSTSSATPSFANLNTFSSFPLHSLGLSDSVGSSLVRPNIISGDGTTDLSVTVVLVGPLDIS